MITNEQILQIAREHLVEINTDYAPNYVGDYEATREQLIAFAQAIYEIGNENGWESRADAEYFNSSYPT